jgi:uncharacterized protein (TIGR00369 family)
MNFTAESIPEGFRRIQFPVNPFIDVNGPLYGRWVDGKFTLGLRIEPRYCNPAKTCHGGMVMTLADMTLLIGASLQAKIRQYMITVRLATDFVGPAHEGEWLEGRCEVLRASKNLVFAHGMLSVGERGVARIDGLFKPSGEPEPRSGWGNFGLD